MNNSLKEIAVRLCMSGENCSRSILLAGAEKYNLQLPVETVSCCNGISAGFGVGGTCSALVAGVMLLGMIYDDDDTAKQKALLLFYMVQGEVGSLNCCSIAGNENCYGLIGIIADQLENIIDL